MNLFKLAVLLLIGLVCVAARTKCPRDKCNNKRPDKIPGEGQKSCRKLKELGQCDADFLRGFCECTCQTCAFFEEIPDEESDIEELALSPFLEQLDE